ncbi:MAG: hypothetical protein LBJ64_09645 [Deltaproteobacteria bacterium]|nr:hypothetical protein [Deltaproteobacteria bacterium]
MAFTKRRTKPPQEEQTDDAGYKPPKRKSIGKYDDYRTADGPQGKLVYKRPEKPKTGKFSGQSGGPKKSSNDKFSKDKFPNDKPLKGKFSNDKFPKDKFERGPKKWSADGPKKPYADRKSFRDDGDSARGGDKPFRSSAGRERGSDRPEGRRNLDKPAFAESGPKSGPRTGPRTGPKTGANAGPKPRRTDSFGSGGSGGYKGSKSGSSFGSKPGGFGAPRKNAFPRAVPKPTKSPLKASQTHALTAIINRELPSALKRLREADSSCLDSATKILDSIDALNSIIAELSSDNPPENLEETTESLKSVAEKLNCHSSFGDLVGQRISRVIDFLESIEPVLAEIAQEFQGGEKKPVRTVRTSKIEREEIEDDLDDESVEKPKASKKRSVKEEKAKDPDADSPKASSPAKAKKAKRAVQEVEEELFGPDGEAMSQADINALIGKLGHKTEE